jgi:phosphoglycolate phosphatase
VKQALIFDLDGTLVDSLQGIATALNHALRLSALPPHSLEAVRGFIGNGARILIERGVPAGSPELLIDQVEQAFKAKYEIAWPQGTSPYPGINRLLETLQERGATLAVLSNKPHAFTVAMVARIFPGIRFGVVLGQRAGIPHKPEPGGALEIAAQLGIAPECCCIIGDSTMDIETAKNAKMKAIAVTWGFHDGGRLVAAGATHIANNPEELLRICETGSSSSQNCQDVGISSAI